MSSFLPLPEGWPAWSIRVFSGLLAMCGVVHLIRRLATMQKVEKKASSSSREFGKFQREYLVVYLVIMLADWLQGTNMYTLYSGYGVSVSTLFLTGFSSSLIFGTFVGLLVDRHGRRSACVLFCVLEIVINLLEHVPNMPLLLVGRVLGGISTSLLFSAFESWMVSEHRNRGFDEDRLAETFSLAATGNGIVAVFAGFAAQVSSDAVGDIGPFRLAIALTVVSLLFVARWPENYGGDSSQSEKNEGSALIKSLQDASKAIRQDKRIALLACVSALFEGATFTFVFMWVPTLLGRYTSQPALPMGLVFACFMVCIAAGGELFGLFVGDHRALLFKGNVEVFSFVLLVVAALSMLVPAPANASFENTLAAFLLLELCVGAFNGCAATMRSKYIPDQLQGAVMNLSRVPLNILVVAGTTLAANKPPQVSFPIVATAFAVGAALQVALIREVASTDKKKI